MIVERDASDQRDAQRVRDEAQGALGDAAGCSSRSVTAAIRSGRTVRYFRAAIVVEGRSGSREAVVV